MKEAKVVLSALVKYANGKFPNERLKRAHFSSTINYDMISPVIYVVLEHFRECSPLLLKCLLKLSKARLSGLEIRISGFSNANVMLICDGRITINGQKSSIDEAINAIDIFAEEDSRLSTGRDEKIQSMIEHVIGEYVKSHLPAPQTYVIYNDKTYIFIIYTEEQGYWPKIKYIDEAIIVKKVSFNRQGYYATLMDRDLPFMMKCYSIDRQVVAQQLDIVFDHEDRNASVFSLAPHVLQLKHND